MLDAAAEGAVSKTIFALLRVDPHRRELETVFQMPAPGARAIVRVWDLDGLINPNMASPALLRAMLDAAGANETQAAAIVRAILDTRGAETGGVTLASATNRPPPRPFASLADFAAVPGMTGALMDVLTPHVGVWGPALPDPGLAAPLVRQALTQSGEMAFAGTVTSTCVGSAAASEAFCGNGSNVEAEAEGWITSAGRTPSSPSKGFSVWRRPMSWPVNPL